MTKHVCVICGALFEKGPGFVEKHYTLCTNNVHGWNYTREVDDDWQRPDGEVARGGRWNEWIDDRKQAKK